MRYDSASVMRATTAYQRNILEDSHLQVSYSIEDMDIVYITFVAVSYYSASCTMSTGGPFPGVKCDRGVTLTTHPT
jgi:hypothetical protein